MEQVHQVCLGKKDSNLRGDEVYPTLFKKIYFKISACLFMDLHTSLEAKRSDESMPQKLILLCFKTSYERGRMTLFEF